MLKRIVVLILLALMLTGCLPGDGKADAENPAGLFWGIWHGWMAPLSLIISIFKKNISIYEIYNTGFWYNLGFYLAIVGGFGSLTWSRKIKGKED